MLSKILRLNYSHIKFTTVHFVVSKAFCIQTQRVHINIGVSVFIFTRLFFRLTRVFSVFIYSALADGLFELITLQKKFAMNFS